MKKRKAKYPQKSSFNQEMKDNQKKKKRKEKKARQAENPKGRSRQKLGVKSQQIENLKMQSEKEKDFIK